MDLGIVTCETQNIYGLFHLEMHTLSRGHVCIQGNDVKLATKGDSVEETFY